MDILWQPRYDMGLNLRVSYQNNRGSFASRTLSPSANLRWQLDSLASLTANYTLQSLRQFDASNLATFGQDTKGLSIRLTRRFDNGSSLDLSYDFQGYDTGTYGVAEASKVELLGQSLNAQDCARLHDVWGSLSNVLTYIVR